MTYEELIEQTKKFQAEAFDIVSQPWPVDAARVEQLGVKLGDFAEALDHCRIAAS